MRLTVQTALNHYAEKAFISILSRREETTQEQLIKILIPSIWHSDNFPHAHANNQCVNHQMSSDTSDLNYFYFH